MNELQLTTSGALLKGTMVRLDIAGDWQGILGERKLRLVIRLTASDADAWKATMYSIDQSTQPIPIDAVVQEGRSLKLAVNAIRGTYEGTLSLDGNFITGNLSQAKPQPLELQRASAESAWLAKPIQQHFVEVEKGVKLEVVDWGGTGRPIVLLAGLGADAHSYARFAAKLTRSYHVYGITRRGFGASSAPLTSYSADRLGDDVLAVLAALDLHRPVLVGHSIAGQELSSVGSRHPSKIAGLVYLDAAWSFAYYDNSLGDLMVELIDMKRRMEELQSDFLQDPRPLIQEVLESGLPKLQRVLLEWQKELDATPAALLAVLAQAASDIPPAVAAIHAGRQRYTHIPVPILAIYALPPAPGERPIGTEAQARAFEAGVPSARVVRLPHARHEVFSSNEKEVLREMNDFIAKLP